MADVLRDFGAAIVHERVFGSLAAESAVMSARRAGLSSRAFPADGLVTYVQGCPPWGDGFAGAIVHAVVSPDNTDGVWPIVCNETVCGRGWRRGDTTFLTLQNLHGLVEGPASANSRAAQVRRMIDQGNRILHEQGASFRDVARTWIYIDEILEWYDEFNQTRNAEYQKIGLPPGAGADPTLLPASTGIEGQAPGGAAATMNLLAVRGPENALPPIVRLQNPRQRDAYRYGSAFSRGAVVRGSDESLIEVSGTAAIDEDGRSQHRGDVRAQIDQTLDTIDVLLGQEGARLEDVGAATAFVKRPEDAQVFWEMAAGRGLDDLPAVCVVADVCRDELLFELDAEAARNTRRAP
jgi:enamine deaminase RidA (YjgF/YER057c/UK114 family)